MAIPRRTLQGGSGRPYTFGGVLNPRGSGLMQQFLGQNPVRTRRPGPVWPGRNGGRPIGPNARPPYQGPRPGDIGRRPPPAGLPPGLGNNPPPGQGGLVPGLGMPLDSLYEGDRRMAQDALTAALAQAQNAYQTGLAQVDEGAMLQNRDLDSSMADAGLFGSGIERKGERLIGNDLARNKLGLLSAFTGQQSGAQMDFQRANQDALLALAARLQGQDTIPLPGSNAGGNPNPRGKATRTRKRKRPNPPPRKKRNKVRNRNQPKVPPPRPYPGGR